MDSNSMRELLKEKQLFRLELDDVAAPSFTSFGKSYYGTIEEIRKFIHALETADYLGDHAKKLIEAFHSYDSGNITVKHSVAYREIPLLLPTKILHHELFALTNHSWEHKNIWNCPYYMRCKEVRTEHLWVQCGELLSSAIYAHFTGLEYQGPLGNWKKVGTMLWGYPELLEYHDPHIHNRLAEPERTFSSIDELERDWIEFRKNPRPDFTEFCNDIFGDG